MKYSDELEKIFDRLVDEVSKYLPDFGQVLAMDSKGIKSHARRRRRDKKPQEPDGRRDIDADFGFKVYQGQREDGS